MMRSHETRYPEFHISSLESYAPFRGTRSSSIKSGSASPTFGSPVLGSPRLPQHGATSQEGALTPSFQQTTESHTQSADRLIELDLSNSSLDILDALDACTNFDLLDSIHPTVMLSG